VVIVWIPLLIILTAPGALNPLLLLLLLSLLYLL
jgi:hypothetical protein